MQNIQRDIPYATPGDKLPTLDIYAPAAANNLPVAFYIHGGDHLHGRSGLKK